MLHRISKVVKHTVRVRPRRRRIGSPAWPPPWRAAYAGASVDFVGNLRATSWRRRARYAARHQRAPVHRLGRHPRPDEDNRTVVDARGTCADAQRRRDLARERSRPIFSSPSTQARISRGEISLTRSPGSWATSVRPLRLAAPSHSDEHVVDAGRVPRILGRPARRPAGVRPRRRLRRPAQGVGTFVWARDFFAWTS